MIDAALLQRIKDHANANGMHRGTDSNAHVTILLEELDRMREEIKRFQSARDKREKDMQNMAVEIWRYRMAINKVLDKKLLRNTSMLASNPPQNAAVWDIQTILREALEKEGGL